MTTCTNNYLKSFLPGEPQLDRLFFFDDQTSRGVAYAVAHASAESLSGRALAVYKPVPYSDLRIVPTVGERCPFFSLAEGFGVEALKVFQPWEPEDSSDDDEDLSASDPGVVAFRGEELPDDA